MDTNDTPLRAAVEGDTIQGADLQASIDALLAMADALGKLVPGAPDPASVLAIGQAQIALTNQAMALVTVQVKLLAGAAAVSAAQIDAAADAALAVIARIAAWKKAVALAADVVGFFGTVLTGDGAAIVRAAIALKASLDAA